MSKIIIRADDLGYSKGINYGIYETLKNGFINNVGVMVNMPSTQHGVDLIMDLDVDLGLHTVISAGRPLSDPDTVSSLVDDFGNFKSSNLYRNSTEDLVDLEEVVVEIDAQYNQFLKLFGRKPDYFEGHAIYSPNFLKGLDIVAKKYDLPLLPFKLDLGPVKFKDSNVIITFMDSMNIHYNPVKTLEKVIDYSSTCANNVFPMMVCHPGFLDQYIINHSSLTNPRMQEVDFACSDKVRTVLVNNNIETIRFSDL
ncbi:ChbG/HpnK family deacetylase [Xylocopilactobacillus apis]|uniref:PTS sugar transporter n=1 Tax=Xylocopilactobacillus apis TaxID=2932183 RepID=A0AAU9CX09_9LACO|nr:ChbG/HpnK family deacetylase [Xylocopilactobacillus apis]BDR55899.1 PTS sugar transporter [Xylocopilactobacillus apis]